MNQSYRLNTEYSPDLEEYDWVGQQRERLPMLSFLIGFFIIVTVSLATRSGWNLAVKGIGVVLVFSSLLSLLRSRISLAPEVIIYIVWMGWSIMGLLGGANQQIFWTKWITLLQILILILIISNFTNSKITLKVTLLSFFLAAVVAGAGSFLSGEFRIENVEAERLTWGMNPNGFGRIMVSATVCLAFFWMEWPSKFVRYFIVIPGMVFCAFACILSASRWSILGLILTYVGWIWFSYKEEAKQNPKIIIGAMFGLLIAGLIFSYMMRDTFAMKRFTSVFSSVKEGEETGSISTRLDLYRNAMNIFFKKPIVGVGLNNYYLHHPSGKVSHSDYSEVVCGTGFPGFVLYMSIYLVLWIRTSRIIKFSYDIREVRLAGLIRTYILVLLLVGLGAPNYTQKNPWILLSAFIGYSNILWQNLSTESQYSDESEKPV